MTIAYHTLGCKVNQYDTEAMRELLESAGYETVPFSAPADVYLINTCTVTGTGDRKSLQLARRVRREHPGCLLVLCGCLAQKEGEALLARAEADLVLGTARRGEIADLLTRVQKEKTPLCAVGPLTAGIPFEPLSISRVSEHTRATVKIQEGCGNHCTYCIIPSVRGPVRSRSLPDLRREVERLRDAGFSEIVLTGIHLASYGRDLPDGQLTLIDALRTVHEVDGVQRIRLGSLEPVVSTEAFCAALSAMPKVCPQFHLALQSGSDTVLARMGRRYRVRDYLEAADRLRAVFPRAAFTTDILTGFPGETEQEFLETAAMIRRMGYARIHVFPFSPREGTPAARMAGQLTAAEKERRARTLIRLGEDVSRAWLETWVNRTALLLPEEKIQGCWEGYTPEYIRVTLPPDAECRSGKALEVKLTALTDRGMSAIPV
ncbi:MAG: tRNA (N(6)-L-threonylcarbamoyladenosine(37)-C(2))-methylthiotransferase MtaB [Clostridia bacterium]|nr:tRNA (N(6)-L-threonylcarbamoyladenosine(37)-C(2))-methylthiotransferase MtaB [Clostridia bacterium]